MEDLHSADCLKYNWVVWFFCGMNFPKTKRCAYFLYSFTYCFFITFGYSLTLTLGIFFIEDIEALIGNLAITSKSLTCTSKWISVFWQTNTLKRIERTMDELDTFATTPVQKLRLKETLNEAHVMFKFYSFVSTLVWLSCGSTMVYQLTRGNVLYPGWYLIDWESSRMGLFVVFFYQLIGVGLEILANTTNDSYPAMLFIALQGHYRILEAALMDFKPGTPKNHRENYGALIKCIVYHKKIERVFASVVSHISIPMFVQYLSTGINLCLIAVSVVFFEVDATHKAYSAIYAWAVTLEMFGPCYFGEELIGESDRLITHLFSCNWVDQDPKFKRALIIFMQNSQAPKIAKVGNLVDISLATFVSVMKFSYSLFALLNTMQN